MNKAIYLSLFAGFAVTVSSQVPLGLKVGTTDAVASPGHWEQENPGLQPGSIPSPSSSQLTFTVNMKPQIDQGNFDPYVDVVGVMINEMDYYQLMELNGWGVYTGTINNVVAASYTYNYMINDETETVGSRVKVVAATTEAVFDWYNDERQMPTTITIEPPDATGWEELTLTVDGNFSCFQSNPLWMATQVYMHSGVVVDDGGFWTHIVNWNGVGMNGQLPLMNSNEDGTFSITFIPNEFYGLQPGEKITDICAVFNGGDWTIDGRDYSYSYICMDYFIPLNFSAVHVPDYTQPDLNIQASPNPASGRTEIRYQLVEGKDIRIALYDIHGAETKVLLNENQTPGNHSIHFDAASLPSGIYCLLVQAGGIPVTKKLVVKH